MCAVCPRRLGLGRCAIPHEVDVIVRQEPWQRRHVWELLKSEDVPAWLAGLGRWPVVA
jgi:hypothetical protein